MIVEGKHIYIYGEKGKAAPLIVMNTFPLCTMTEKELNLAVISDINWNEEMSPWECAPLYKNDSPYTGGADKYLDKLTGSIIPAIKAELGAEPGYLNDLNY